MNWLSLPVKNTVQAHQETGPQKERIYWVLKP